MKNKGPILVLLLVAVGLGIALIVVHKQASDQKEEAIQSLTVASNNFTSAKKQVGELLVVNQTLETNLSVARTEFSNKLALADANLRTIQSNLEKAAADAKAQAKALADSNAIVLAQKDQKISELTAQNEFLDKEDASLRAAITNLDTRIAATQSKLDKSEGDRAFLANELRVLKAEKENMLRRFNDITAVREQLHKLKLEAAISRKLDKTRKSIDETFKNKEGELTMETAPAVPPSSSGGASVELRQSGGVKIQKSPATNAPPK